MKSLISFQAKTPLKGNITVPGDKSISHRSLIFSSLANGISNIYGILEGEDVIKTATALRKMGADIRKIENNHWQVNGVGVCGLNQPDDVLDMGNSGTSTRLLMGLVSSFDFTTFFTGDDSLRKRPMKRVFDPIKEIGAQVIARENNLLPAAIIGADQTLPITYKMPVASAQVKSSIMLSALNIIGTTTIIEPEKCRDHTEIMMKYLGLDIKIEDLKGGNKILINGGNDFAAKDFKIPGDISSAAFIIVAALIIPNSDIVINNVGINPLRSGIISTLQDMGGDIIIKNERKLGEELVADIAVKYSYLKAIEIKKEKVPSMIDEYPILAIAAANASGITKMYGLEELKVKESDRLKSIADGLNSCGIEVKIEENKLEITGGLNSAKDIVNINTNLDHRIAMSFLIMGLKLKNGLRIDDSQMIKTSFPNFIEIFNRFGIDFKNG